MSIQSIFRLRYACSAFVLLALASPASGQKDQAPAQLIRELEGRLNDAYVRQDAPLLAKVLATDGSFTTTDGRTVDKQNRVSALSRKFPDMTNDVKSVAILGDVAVVNSVTSYTTGSGTRSSSAVLRVWHRRPEGWQVVASQATLQATR